MCHCYLFWFMFQIKCTDKYTKLICAECTSSVYAFCWHKKVVDAGQRLLAERIQMAEQVIIIFSLDLLRNSMMNIEGRHLRLYTAFIAFLSVYNTLSHYNTSLLTPQHSHCYCHSLWNYWWEICNGDWNLGANTIYDRTKWSVEAKKKILKRLIAKMTTTTTTTKWLLQLGEK